jgi:hypothetical protein
MIVFDLLCAQGHAFEGWFASGGEFDRQKEARLVTCPVCDGSDVERRPSAKVRVAKAPQAAPAPVPVAGIPPELLAKLREVVRNTEDVGERFPEEARKIHYDEAPPRSIRGRASREEAQELADEGIEFSPLPPLLTRETH